MDCSIQKLLVYHVYIHNYIYIIHIDNLTTYLCIHVCIYLLNHLSIYLCVCHPHQIRG